MCRNRKSLHSQIIRTYSYFFFREAQKYLFKPDQLHKLQKCDEIDNFEKRGKSLLVVVSTPPSGNYENFTEKVREYNTKEPFNFTMPPLFNNYIKVKMNSVDKFVHNVPFVVVSSRFDLCFHFQFNLDAVCIDLCSVSLR